MIVNLTPHAVTLIVDDGTAVIPPGGTVARVTLMPDWALGTVEVDGFTVPVVGTASTGQVTGLPELTSGVLLVVARQVAQALPDRHDLVCPHNLVRDEAGVVIGCRSLAQPE